MALEAVVFPQNLSFNYATNKDLYTMLENNWSFDDDFCSENVDEERAAAASFDFLGNQTESYPYGDWNPSPSSMVPHFNELHLSNPSSEAGNNPNGPSPSDFQPFDESTPLTARPKRRRSRSRKNKEDIENQRMTHIAVERNRRKQMNEYLSMLKSIMPDSYVQRGDQASIIGGAINFVKELEQQVQFLGAQKEIKSKNSEVGVYFPFSEFFTFPQYSTQCENSVAMADSAGDLQTNQSSSIADIEVTMVESHANIKIRSKRRSKQLLKMVSGLHSLRLTILHLNVTTEDGIVLYSLSVKVEDDCKLNSVDEIATALYQILAGIQEETLLN
ncbi:hypothetical protein UlMin_029294 [Ulmus minor]